MWPLLFSILREHLNPSFVPLLITIATHHTLLCKYIIQYTSHAREGSDIKVEPGANEKYEQGIVFYMDKNRVVGVVTWNIFGKIPIARQVSSFVSYFCVFGCVYLLYGFMQYIRYGKFRYFLGQKNFQRIVIITSKSCFLLLWLLYYRLDLRRFQGFPTFIFCLGCTSKATKANFFIEF